MAAMVIVNNPGSWSHVYPPLRHAEWHGCTPTDLIFPYFLFIVGAAVAFSKAGARDRSAWLAMLRRAGVLFALGLGLNASSMLVTREIDFAHLRIMGVLQRIALVYVLVFAATRLLNVRAQVALAAMILLGYAAVLHWAHTPGVAAGVLTPEGNFAGWIDRMVLTQAHLYRQGPMDPEGLLSTLPAMVTALLGFWSGRLLAASRGNRMRSVLRRLAITGAVLIAAGWAWDRLGHPINKSLWTGSYVLLTGGWAMITLALCVWIGERQSWSRLTVPFVVLGRNAILLFVGSGLAARLLSAVHVSTDNTGRPVSAGRWFYEQVCSPLAGPLNGSLLNALTMLAVWWMILWFCWRRRWFWKV